MTFGCKRCMLVILIFCVSSVCILLLIILLFVFRVKFSEFKLIAAGWLQFHFQFRFQFQLQFFNLIMYLILSFQ